MFIKQLKKEKGQAAVEFALVVPLFLALVFFTIEMGWMAYQFLSFDYAYRQASWEMQIDYNDDDTHVISGATATNAIKGAILDVSSAIKSSDLSVSDATYVLHTAKKYYYTPTASGGTTRHLRRWRYADVYANVAYNIRPVTFIGKKIFGSTIPVHKELEKLRLINTREDSD